MSRKYKSFQVEAGGSVHTVEVRRKTHRFFVSVDGNQLPVMQGGAGGFWFGVYRDFDFQVAGEPFVLAVRGAHMHLATGGRYVDIQQPHIPPAPLPAWIWLFAVLNVLTLFYTIAGAAGGAYNWVHPSARMYYAAFDGAMAGALAACGFMLCMYLVKGGFVGKKPLVGTGAKLAGCAVVTALAWALWYVWGVAFTL